MDSRTQITFSPYRTSPSSEATFQGPIRKTSLEIRQEHSLFLAEILAQTLSPENAGPTKRDLKLQIQKRENRLTEAFASLSPLAQEQIRKGPLGENLGEFFSLSRESHPDRFAAGLYSIALRQEGTGSAACAGLLYQSLGSLPGGGRYATLAKQRWDIFQGGGNFGQRAEFLTHQFVPQATDPGFLSGMLVANGLFRGVFSLASRAFAGPAFLGKTAAWTAAFAAEVPGFTFTVRGIHELQGKPQLWTREAVRHDLLSAGLTLFALKAAGATGRFAIQQVKNIPAVPGSLLHASKQAFPQFSMLTGILAAHGMEVSLGWRKGTTPGIALMESLATLLQFNVAGGLLQGISMGGSQGPSPESLGKKILLGKPRGFFSSKVLSYLIPKSRNGLGMVTPEGVLASDLNINMASDTPRPSSSPPTSLEPLERKLPHKSGVRHLHLDPPDAEGKHNLSKLSDEIFELYQGRNPELPWLEIVQRVSKDLLRETEKINTTVSTLDKDSTQLPIFSEIIIELKRIGVLLQKLKAGQEANGKRISPLTDSKVSEFLRHLYVFPNKVANYLQGTDFLDYSHFTLERARRSLEVINGLIHEPLNPLFEPSLKELLVSETQRISGESLRIYHGSSREPNPEKRALTLLDEFKNVLSITLDHLKKDSNHGAMVGDLNSALRDLTKIIQILERTPLSGPGPDPRFENFLLNIYQAHMMFNDFLEEGKTDQLFEARTFIRQAKVHLNDPSSQSPSDPPQN